MYIPSDKDIAAREFEKNDSERLINHISSVRTEQISNFFNNNPKVLDLEKKYGKYLYVPLDLPKFELPDEAYFLDWWNNHCSDSSNVSQSPQCWGGHGFKAFETIDLISKIGDDWETNMQQDAFKKEFPHLWQQFFDQLPCNDILRITLWSSIKNLPEHRDDSEFIDVPASFRIKLYDNNPEETLFLFDNPRRPYDVGETHMLPKLPDTNAWVWNNLRIKHGSVYNPGHKKILAVIIGATNPDQYDELLARSIDKYSDLCIVSKNTIENYVNL
jgi:hypothetical protein